MPAALFGITNDALNLVVNLVILFLIVLWLALVAWTFFDARRRLEDRFLVICATACSLLFPYLGTIVYSILRPPEYLADQRERALEIRASELRVRQLEEASCPNCEHPVERTFLRCPNCRARIKDPCESCGKPIDPRWSICPYCETPVRRAAAPERERERRAQPKRRAKQPAGPAVARPTQERASAKPAADTQERASAKPASEAEAPPAKTRSASGRKSSSRSDDREPRKPSGSRPSRPSSRTAQQRATTSRQPKRGSE